MPETPDVEESVSREARLTSLFESLQRPPMLGRAGPSEFQTLSVEFTLMKLYAMGLEEKLAEAREVLHELISVTTPKEPIDAGQATDEENPNDGRESSVEGEPDHPHKH